MSMTKPFSTLNEYKIGNDAAPHPNIGFFDIKPNDAIHLFILGYDFKIIKTNLREIKYKFLRELLIP